MPTSSRILTAAAALLLLALYALPVWHIGLTAPQYPEGLGMYIGIDTITGATEFDLARINNLNHYIGMRPIAAEAVPELRILPWLVAALFAAGLAVAALGRRRLLYAWLAAFAVLGVAGVADFYRWGYAYGHNLDPETAIIKVPGMSYQPPLIGTKQLLNFTATSWPAAGGWLALAAFALGALAVVVAIRSRRRAAAAAALLLAACVSHEPHTLAYDGSERCAYCGMAIIDRRFGAELVTTTGRVYEFDSIECLASFYAQARTDGTVASVWVSDFEQPGTLLPAERARFVRSRGPRSSPMGLGFIALGPAADAEMPRQPYGGTVAWSEVVALVVREGFRSKGTAAHVPASASDLTEGRHAPAR